MAREDRGMRNVDVTHLKSKQADGYDAAPS